MKKLLLAILGVLIALPGLAQDFTYTYEGQTLTYTVIDEDAKTCRTKAGDYGYTGNNVSGELIIPSIAKDGDTEFTVTEIGDCAFFICSGLTSVTIPNSVTSIGYLAFRGCSGLTSVTIPNSVTSIRDQAFEECSGLTSVTIGNSVTSIGGEAFGGCSGLETVYFNAVNCTECGSWSSSAFPSTLKNVVIGENVTNIPDNAFYGCSGLTSVTIGSAVRTIGNAAFCGCTGLASVAIPNSCPTIGDGTFEGCYLLASVTIGNSVTSIGERAFAGCSSLTEIVLPESLKTIGNECFTGCELGTIIFKGRNIEHIGSLAFSSPSLSTGKDRNELSQFEGGENLKYLGNHALGDNIQLIRLNCTTPPKLESPLMGYSEYVAYNILVIVPANSDDAYKKNDSWNGFHIVEAAPTTTVVMTGNYSLAEEIASTTQQMPGNVTSLAIIGPLADSDWDIIKRNLISCYDLDISRVTNTEIPAGAFAGNQHLLSLRLPEGTKTIGDKAFSNCKNLVIDKLPETVETIGNNAFEGCRQFNVDALPESLKQIGERAFSECRKLQLTSLPAVESIGQSAFEYCPRFMDLDMSATKITTIEAFTFRGCFKLRNVTLPETLTSIEEGAFGSTSVNFITFPESLTNIGPGAFADTPLIAVDIPRNVKTICSGAFKECYKMKSVSLSSKMESIGSESFAYNRAIASISVPCAVPPTVENRAFDNLRYRDVLVAIPSTKCRDYLNALGWGAFTQLSNSIFMEFEEVDENGQEIPEGEGEDDVDTGVAENGAYDDIVDNVTDEEENAAGDRESDNSLYGDDEQNPENIAARVQRARAIAREEAKNTVDLKARRAFTRLYSGLSMTIGDNSGYRVKIEPKKDVRIVKIEFDGKDITNTYIDGMITLPTQFKSSKLKIYRTVSESGVKDVTASERKTSADVYTLQGIMVLRDATEAQVRDLKPGMYIYKGRKILVK